MTNSALYERLNEKIFNFVFNNLSWFFTIHTNLRNKKIWKLSFIRFPLTFESQNLLKKTPLILYLILGLNSLLHGQIDRQDTPLAWSVYAPELPTVIFNTSPEPNLSVLQSEDIVLDSNKQNDYRFAVPLPFNLTTDNSGRWTSLPGGDRLWQLGVRLESALSLNVFLSELELPSGSKLFIYSPDHEHYLGDFVGKVGDSFATTPIAGNRLIIEFYEPAEAYGQGHIKLERVGYGYRSIQPGGHLFGYASECSAEPGTNNNSVSNALNATVLIMTRYGTSLRTGVMVNNSGPTLQPFLLTSAVAEDEETEGWCFIFSRNNVGSKEGEAEWLGEHVIRGAEVVQSYSNPNMSLLRLSEMPNPQWNTYYSGWQLGEPSGEVFNVHYPKGDLARIGLKDEAAPQANFKIAIRDWDEGVTECASIGSPLFTSNGRILGIMDSGNAMCHNNGTDIFTRLSAAWAGPDGLKNYLDPKNHSQFGLEGRPGEQDPEVETPESSVTGVYPNPSQTFVNFTIKKGYKLTKVVIMDATGAELPVEFTTDARGISFDRLSPGVYLVQLWIGDLPETHRIIVSR